jgi:hypothetical protein
MFYLDYYMNIYLVGFYILWILIHLFYFHGKLGLLFINFLINYLYINIYKYTQYSCYDIIIVNN